MKLSGWLGLLLALASSAYAQKPALLDILQQELERNFTVLKQKGDPPPYYMAYDVTDTQGDVVTATQGALEWQNHQHVRLLDVTVRVGSRKLDNYHRVRGIVPPSGSTAAIALEDNANAIRQRAWLETDRAYRSAEQRLMEIKTNQQVTISAKDDSDDFSSEEPSVFIQAPPEYRFSATDWANRLRKLSAKFSEYPRLLSSNVSVSVSRETKYMVNTEGTRLEHGRIFARILISARAKAGDGMDLSTSESFEANDPERLPKDQVLAGAVDRVGKDLTALLAAPPVDPFVGPAILSGRAAGVFFHEIFGHRVEGHRQKDESEGQTFSQSVGQQVLPAFLSVIFDPTRSSTAGVDLNGSYQYDDEGVKALPVAVVDHGILKTFLLSRSPVQGFPHSNGHGRRQPGRVVVSRQSNLLVESQKAVSEARLRQMLREEITRQNKPYGLYFKEVTGGYTQTARRGLQAFTVIPLIVYRVYADGRPDELVRGVDIVGTPLASFAKIVATSDQPEVFNGYCGAESGDVPVSAVSPAILVSEIEVQRKQTSQDLPPILPRPPVTGGAQ